MTKEELKRAIETDARDSEEAAFFYMERARTSTPALCADNVALYENANDRAERLRGLLRDIDDLTEDEANLAYEALR